MPSFVVVISLFMGVGRLAPGREEKEEKTWEDDDGVDSLDEEERMPRLLFLLEKNNAGRDAAAEATAFGHDEVAGWLESVVDRLDPNNDRKKNFADLSEDIASTARCP